MIAVARVADLPTSPVGGYAALLLSIFTIPLAGCLGLPPVESTIPGTLTRSGDGRSDTLVVMLPGRGDRAEAFEVAGFEEAGLQFGFDSMAIDAHTGYYVQRSLVDRLHEDIVEPAREQGYRNVWILGISMGGLGALLYASEYPDHVDGLVLLAPYLGERRSIEMISASGSVSAHGDRAEDLESYEIDIWTWLEDEPGENRPPIVLGYGTSDRMAAGYDSVMDLIQPSSVHTREGGHRWSTWRPLWDEIAVVLDSYLR